MSEATGLPTEPQPVPFGHNVCLKTLIHPLRLLFINAYFGTVPTVHNINMVVTVPIVHYINKVNYDVWLSQCEINLMTAASIKCGEIFLYWAKRFG